LIAALYNGAKEATISTEVTFEDGRKGRIEGDMMIIDLVPHKITPAPIREAAE
jgi:long-chain acyl-CoA synthetase